MMLSRSAPGVGAMPRRAQRDQRLTLSREALAAGVSIFELSRLMGASVKRIDRHYGHLARDAEETIRARLEARSTPKEKRLGVEWAPADGND